MDMDYTSWFAAIQANIDVRRISRSFLSRASRKARISRASTKTTTSVPARSSLRTPVVYASLLLSTAAEGPQNAPHRRRGRSAREAEASPAEFSEGGQLADPGTFPFRTENLTRSRSTSGPARGTWASATLPTTSRNGCPIRSI